jgi:hypothetical protein
MHWSRLLDAGMVGFLHLADWILGPTAGEIALVNLWPVLVSVPFIAALAVAARSIGGTSAAAISVLVVIGSPLLASQFQPGALDHHNIQLALVACILAGLARFETTGAAMAVGIAAGVSLSIGMEQLPLIGGAVMLIAVRWVWLGHAAQSSTISFGVAFATTVLVLFLATVDPARWFVPACDAHSVSYLLPAVVGGLGLATIAGRWTPKLSPVPELRMRTLALVGLAAITITSMALPSSACLNGPFAQVDSRLYPVWLSHVEEMRSLGYLLANEPGSAIGVFVAPALVLVGSIIALRRALLPARFSIISLVVLLLIAFTISLWQVRAASAAQAIAALLSGLLIAQLRESAPSDPSLSNLRYRIGGIVCVPILWALIATPLSGAEEESGASTGQTAGCRSSLVAALKSRPAGVVAASSDLGSLLLLTTRHPVLSAPYHRNAAGILAAADLWRANAEDAHRIVATHSVKYIAICTADREEMRFVHERSNGFLAHLVRDPPVWLSSLLNEGDARVFEVKATEAHDVSMNPVRVETQAKGE